MKLYLPRNVILPGRIIEKGPTPDDLSLEEERLLLNMGASSEPPAVTALPVIPEKSGIQEVVAPVTIDELHNLYPELCEEIARLAKGPTTRVPVIAFDLIDAYPGLCEEIWKTGYDQGHVDGNAAIESALLDPGNPVSEAPQDPSSPSPLGGEGGGEGAGPKAGTPHTRKKG